MYRNGPCLCGYATEFVDRKGKIRRRYDTYLTPYERSWGLPQAEQSLQPGGDDGGAGTDRPRPQRHRVRPARSAGEGHALPFLRSAGYSTLTAHASMLILGPRMRKDSAPESFRYIAPARTVPANPTINANANPSVLLVLPSAPPW